MRFISGSRYTATQPRAEDRTTAAKKKNNIAQPVRGRWEGTATGGAIWQPQNRKWREKKSAQLWCWYHSFTCKSFRQCGGKMLSTKNTLTIWAASSLFLSIRRMRHMNSEWPLAFEKASFCVCFLAQGFWRNSAEDFPEHLPEHLRELHFCVTSFYPSQTQ